MWLPINRFKLLIVLLLVIGSVHAARVPGPDVDQDEVYDWQSCVLENDSLQCEGVNDSDAGLYYLYYAMYEAYGSMLGDANYNADVDLNHDGGIGIRDYFLLLNMFSHANATE